MKLIQGVTSIISDLAALTAPTNPVGEDADEAGTAAPGWVDYVAAGGASGARRLIDGGLMNARLIG